jgi:glycerol-3-phosphate dehydrogenase subunit C
MIQQGKFPLRSRLRNNLVARAETLAKVAQPIAPLSNIALSYPLARIAAEEILGISRHAPFPPYTKQRFTTWFSRRDSHRRIEQSFSTIERPKVVYFHGCSTEYYEPRVGRAAVRVLEINGFEVLVPPQNCCGLPLLSNGEFKAARRYHSSNVRKLVEFARKGIPIVGTSTSCTLTLKEEAPELLEMYDEDTMLVAQNTYDLNEFLLLLLDNDRLNLEFKTVPLRLPYHVPCQYRAHRIGNPGVEMLKLIPQLQVTESHAACCGIAGTYGYKREKYDIAMKVGADLFNFIRDFNSPLALCDSETCRWQITHATRVPVIHPIELLAYAYGFEPEEPLRRIVS